MSQGQPSVSQVAQVIRKEHDKPQYCDVLSAALRLNEDEQDIIVCEKCPEDEDTDYTKPPVLWRAGEGVVT